MDKALIFLLLLVAFPAHTQLPAISTSKPPAAGGVFSLVQFKFHSIDGGTSGTGGGACATNSNSCIVNVSAIGAGHLVVVASLMGQNGAGGTMSAPTANGQTWVHCTGCAFGSVANGNTDAYYTLNSASNAATTETCNFSANRVTDIYNSCMVFEYAYTGSSISFDVAGGGTDTSCSTACAGPAMTLTGTNDVVIQLALSIPSIAPLSTFSDATYTAPGNPPPYYAGTGTAAKINATSYSVPTWGFSSGTSNLVVLGIAFKGN